MLGWLFALFAVIASFGIGNLTQGNSISSALDATFGVPVWVTGIVITVLALAIILGGIKSISKVSQVVVPLMAVFYVVAGLIIIIGNIRNVPAGVVMIFKMAFSVKAVGGGLCGSIVASMMQAIRFGVARGVFSNEAGMGSAAITAAAASTNDPVRQGYINMTGTFWDTIVVCTITGLCIASSGVLGSTDTSATGTYYYEAADEALTFSLEGNDGKTSTTRYTISDYQTTEDKTQMFLVDGSDTLTLTLEGKASPLGDAESRNLTGTWEDDSANEYVFANDGKLEYRELVVGSALTISAFETILGHGEKAFEYLFGTHRFNLIYRIVFSLMVFVGATTTLKIAWNFSDIANALMAIPNLICMLAMSGVIVEEVNRYQKVIQKEKRK